MLKMALNQSQDFVDAPRQIHPTPEELKASAYDSSNVEAALEALHQDGFVVLKSVVDVKHIENLNSYMAKDAEHLIKIKPFNQGVNCKWALFWQAQTNMSSEYSSSSSSQRAGSIVQRCLLQSFRHTTHECVSQVPASTQDDLQLLMHTVQVTLVQTLYGIFLLATMLFLEPMGSDNQSIRISLSTILK